jgi:hypothetical protein
MLSISKVLRAAGGGTLKSAGQRKFLFSLFMVDRSNLSDHLATPICFALFGNACPKVFFLWCMRDSVGREKLVDKKILWKKEDGVIHWQL